MVGLTSTTSSLARCYEGSSRRINYPLMKNFEHKRMSNAIALPNQVIVTDLENEEAAE